MADRTETAASHGTPRSLGQNGVGGPRGGHADGVFLFFSNRLGCLGSLLVSAILTLIVLVILGVL